MKRDYRNAESDKRYLEYRDKSIFPVLFEYDKKTVNCIEEGALKHISSVIERNGEVETTNMKFRVDDNLTLRVKLTHYFSHGATEWTLFFKNKSDENTKRISNVRTVIDFEGEKPTLDGNLGDHENMYRPYHCEINDGDVHFIDDLGRATHRYFPYFNLGYGDRGSMLAIGWGGNWEAFFRKTPNGVQYEGKSVYDLDTYLKPGEEIRTALFALCEYTIRDNDYATNYWRDWYVEYTAQKMDKNGTPFSPMSTYCFAGETGLPNSDGSISERYYTWRPVVDKMQEVGVHVDVSWLDAGWYIAPDLKSAEPYVRGHDWWDTVGTWEPDPVKWPGNTLAGRGDYTHKMGMKNMVWFEPERVTFLDDLVKNFGYKHEWAIYAPGNPIVNNIGNPECFEWTAKRICDFLTKNHIDISREDNNSDPGKLWSYLDEKEGEGRKGFTECKLIDAHYRLWDRIIACTLANGGCGFVDSCASGGGRNDLESMRRGYPFMRSDADRTTTARRLSMGYSFCKWIPLHGACTSEKKYELNDVGYADVYSWRASYLPFLNLSTTFVNGTEETFKDLKFGLNEW
ncbi:MAG: alpha-galactosidase, partial [Clostridia bacterium]|nr:alpha-galactosidase [Clostridia bacterium]